MSKERALRILKSTRTLLKDPKRWCAGRWAKDDQGNACSFKDPQAACWCLEGAIRKISSELEGNSHIDAIVALREPCLTTLNDKLHEQGDHKAMLKLIDNGIARLSGGRLRL